MTAKIGLKAVISLENTQLRRYTLNRTHMNLFFQMLDTVFRWCLLFPVFCVIFLSRRYADTQIPR